MSLTRDDMLNELELLPVWQLRNLSPNAGEGACATTTVLAASEAVSAAQAPSPATQPEKKPLLEGIHNRGYLPHLKAEGGIYAVTFRLSDSLPAEALEQLAAYATQTGNDEIGINQEQKIQIETWLNAGHGACWLKQPQVAACVKDALLTKNDVDYRLHAWVIMPNHVHIVLEPLGHHALSDILHAIKSTSAHHANIFLQRSGSFWQRESYDHLVRDEDDFQRCCEYVRQNPVKAGLVSEANAYPWGDIYAGEGACATETAEVVAQAPSPASDAASFRAEKIRYLDWQALQTCVPECTACSLATTRTQTVFGVGDPNADWLIIGEAPGAEEDRKGEPFVGQAGKLLDNMLAAIQLKRGSNVYIANVLKCRPPENRDPHGEEVIQCDPFLKRQVELIKPKLILALGKFAAQSLLASDNTIASMRGKLHDYHGVPVIVTYHPAYLLRNLPDKAKAWEDLCMARKTMASLQSGELPPST